MTISLELIQNANGELGLIQYQTNYEGYAGYPAYGQPLDERTLGDKVKAAIDAVFIKSVEKSLNDTVKEKAEKYLDQAYDDAFKSLQVVYPELVRYGQNYAYLGDYLFHFRRDGSRRLGFYYFYDSNTDNNFETVSIDSWPAFAELIQRFPNPKETQKSFLTKYNI